MSERSLANTQLNGVLSRGRPRWPSARNERTRPALRVGLHPREGRAAGPRGRGHGRQPAGRSATVAPLDLDELPAIYRNRRLLEPDLAPRAVRGLSDQMLDQLYGVAAELGDPNRSMDDIYHAEGLPPRVATPTSPPRHLTSTSPHNELLARDALSRWDARDRSS
jgi:hypothetical protein